MTLLCASTVLTTIVPRQTGLFSSSKRQPAVRGGVVTVRARVSNLPVDNQLLKKNVVAEFYDELLGAWENIWGEHIHHGFYDPDDDAVKHSDHRSAQIRMIEEALQFASIPEDPSKKPKCIVDVGYGLGGSTRYLSRKYGAKCHGIYPSSLQAERAQALTAAQGLSNKVSFQVGDAMNLPFPDGKFDLVWALEIGKHLPNKLKFVSELTRVAAPGATIIILTLCHRDLSPSENSLRPEEKRLLDKICDGFYLPKWCSTADYIKIMESLSLKDIKYADWSKNAAPFWPAVIRSALTWDGLISMIRSGWKTTRGAFIVPLMMEGFQKGVIKFSIITCRKPEEISDRNLL